MKEITENERERETNREKDGEREGKRPRSKREFVDGEHDCFA